MKEKKTRLFQRRHFTKSLIIFVGLALSIVFFFFLFYYGKVSISFGNIVSAIKPFIIGGVIAYLFVTPCNFFEKHLNKLFSKIKKMKPKTASALSGALSIILSLLLALSIIVLLLALIIPQIIDSVSVIVANFDKYYNTAMNWINDIFANNKVIHDYVESITDSIITTAENWLKTDLLPSAKSLVVNVSSGVVGAFSVIVDIIVSIIVSLYFLSSRKKFAAQCKIFVHSLFKEKIANKIISETQFANKMFMGFISGRLLDSLVIGVLTFVGLLILRVPYPLLIGVIVGVTNIIPFFGPYLGSIPSALLLLLVDPIKCLWFIIFIIVLQQIDGNLIGPKIVGEKTNLNSFWVLFAILLFSGMFGFIGMLIGVPVFAVIYHLAQELIMKGLKRTKYVPSAEDAEVSLLTEYLEKEGETELSAKIAENNK